MPISAEGHYSGKTNMGVGMMTSPLLWIGIFAVSVAFLGCGVGVMWLFRHGPRKYGKVGTALLMGGLGGLMLALPLWAVGLLYPSEWQPRHLLGPLCMAIPASLFIAAVMYVHILTFEAALDLFWRWVGKKPGDRSERKSGNKMQEHR